MSVTEIPNKCAIQLKPYYETTTVREGHTFPEEILQYGGTGRYASINIPQCNAVVTTTTI